MNINELIKELGVALGMPDLQLNPEGCARLVFDGTTAINLEVDAERGCLHLYSLLGSVPLERRDAVLYSMLKGNLFGNKTAGATLAIDSLCEEAVLCRSIELEYLSVPRLTNILEKFVKVTELWVKKIDKKTAPEPPRNPCRPVDFI